MPAPSFQAFPMPPPVIHPVYQFTAVMLLKGVQLPIIQGNIGQLNKFDYSRIPDPMTKFEKWGGEITDDLMDGITEARDMVEEAKKEFEKTGDFEAISLHLDSDICFAFVVDNYKPLQDMEIFEEAFFETFIKAKTNNSNIPWSVISDLLKMADREKLMSKGDPLPEKKDTYTLYRGIAGKGAARRKYGQSWTGTFDKAKWFAKRLSLEKPMVYKAIVPKDCICFYTNVRNEDEYVCLIPDKLKLVEVWRQE
jgi:hypothetical protein